MATATPKGTKIPIAQVQDSDISIAHRPHREVFNEANAGSAFKTEAAQRSSYQDHLDWPLVNRFPSADVTYEPTVTEIGEHCKDFCVVPDYWKFQILLNDVPNRFRKWRLDFNQANRTPKDSLPHGAASVMRDEGGMLRFTVWDRIQLHRDVGERLGLRRQYSKKDFLIKCNLPGNYGHVYAAAGHRAWCLGDPCPPDYMFPQDWDVLGQKPTLRPSLIVTLPTPQHTAQVASTVAAQTTNTPFKKEGTPLATTPLINTIAGHKRDIPVTKDDPKPKRFRPSTIVALSHFNPDLREEDTLRPSLIVTLPTPQHAAQVASTVAAQTTNAPFKKEGTPLATTPLINTIAGHKRFPKGRISLDASSDTSEDPLMALHREVKSLRKELGTARNDLGRADFRIKTIVEYSAHQDWVINHMGTSFEKWKHCEDEREKREIVKSINDALHSSETGLDTLDTQIPGFEDLIGDHKNTQNLLDWLNGSDYINTP